MDLSTKEAERDFRQIEKKAKKVWRDMRENSIEINFRTSPLGIIMLLSGVMAVICIARCIGKMEQKCAIKKQAKAMAKEQEAAE